MTMGDKVIDNSGNCGVVIMVKDSYSLILWSYGKFCFNWLNFKKNNNGIYDMRIR